MNSTAAEPQAQLLHDVHARLTQLIPQLHDANVRCVDAAEPLARLDDLTTEQKRQLAANIRATNEHWEQVTLLINQALAPVRIE